MSEYNIQRKGGRSMREQEEQLFASAPVAQAVLKLALPAAAGQIILVIYNMADTFFIGLTGSNEMLSAVTVCMPAFINRAPP